MGSEKRLSAEERRLNLARAAALEWRERYRKVLAGQDSVWNSAIDNCSSLFGDLHNPMHRPDECLLCYVHGKLKGAYRLENAGYVTVKERLLSKLSSMEDHAHLSKEMSRQEMRAYCMAIKDMRVVVDRFVTDGI